LVPSISSRARRLISAPVRDADRVAFISLPFAAIALAVASAVSLAYEVLLTRLFSLLFEYHFVFVATSLAICGLGLGAALGAWLLAHKRLDMLNPGRIVLALALALAVDSLVFSLLPWAGAVYFQAALALPPFVLIGLLTALIFTSRPQESARLYASDLLGAAVGTVVVLLLIVWSGVFTAILWLALLAVLLALLLTYVTGDRPALNMTAAAALLIALLVLVGQVFDLPKFNAAAIGGAPPDKTMLRILQDPTQNAHIAETVWGPFARLDLVETSDPDTKLVFTDGGAGSYMIHFDGDLGKVSDLETDPDYLPFSQGIPTDTLVLGAGAGKDVLLALLAGSKHITAVELNQDVVDLTRRYASFNGNILDRPGVQTVVSDGRSFVEQTNQKYDLIYLNLVYSQAAGHEGSPLAESYVFTEEAFRSYWRHLKPGGTIGIVTHNGFEGSRTLLTAIAALEDEGLLMRQALDRVQLYQEVSDDPNAATSVLLVTRYTLDEAGLSNNVKMADGLGMREMYLPVLFELPLKDLVKGNAGIYDFARNGDYNLVPTTDDQPFFYQILWGLPGSLLILLVLTSLAVLIYLAVTTMTHRRAGGPGMGVLALYFAVLGAAYMLVLVPLVQRYYLLLGNPTLALVVTLEGLLFGAGLGSLFSSRLRGTLVRPVTVALIVLVVLLVAHALLYPLLRDSLLQTSLFIRITAVVALTLPLGLLIGLPFPSGLRIAGSSVPGAVPTLWGLNALAAVLGSALASAVAMVFGFQVVLLVAAGLYAIAAVLLNLIRQRRDAA
jgi:SAM-dependent methyltransferase